MLAFRLFSCPSSSPSGHLLPVNGETRLGRPHAILMVDHSLQRGGRAGFQLDHEDPVEIDRAWHRKLAARDLAEAERPVIRFVTDQDDRRRAGFCRGVERYCDKLAADADVLEIRANGKRS